MQEKIIGRIDQVQRLQQFYNSNKPEFVAIYGRRRVGKTFLIRNTFANKLTFELTGLPDSNINAQLAQFHVAMEQYFTKSTIYQTPTSWQAAFKMLGETLEQYEYKGKKVLFIDELPWLDTRKSGFLQALQHFWNSWASRRKDILLIVCGSAAAWMIKKILLNKGGLHNRVTATIKLDPFTLAETKDFLKSRRINYDRYQIITLYMVLGGIPYYLDQLQVGLSATQNIDKLCFGRNARLTQEFNNLFASLFSKHENHISVIRALATKRKGLNRHQIVQLTKLTDGGGLSRILKELEESDFIRKYRYFGKTTRNALYQLTDLFSLFHLSFIQHAHLDDDNVWINLLQSPTYRSWSGYAFEMVCLRHTKQIKAALGISGIQSSISSWHSSNSQIDLLIDRKDQVINICEMKFSLAEYSITKKYAAQLRNKIEDFRLSTNSKKALFLTMITTYGLKQNVHSGLVQNDLTMEIFFN